MVLIKRAKSERGPGKSRSDKHRNRLDELRHNHRAGPPRASASILSAAFLPKPPTAYHESCCRLRQPLVVRISASASASIGESLSSRPSLPARTFKVHIVLAHVYRHAPL